MVKLLIESGARVDETDFTLAPNQSCQTMLWRDTPDRGYQTTLAGMGPDEPRSRAFRAVIQLGHNELINLVYRKGQIDIPSIYKPIWPSITEAVCFYKANISIIQLLPDKEISKESCYLLFTGYRQCKCCDMILKLFLNLGKSFARPTYFANPQAVSFAALHGNNPLINTLLEMGTDLDCIDNHNRTPIMRAAYSGHYKTFKLLLEKGATKDSKRDPNITTLSLAREIGSSSIGRKEPFWWQDKEEKRRIVTYLLKSGQR